VGWPVRRYCSVEKRVKLCSVVSTNNIAIGLVRVHRIRFQPTRNTLSSEASPKRFLSSQHSGLNPISLARLVLRDLAALLCSGLADPLRCASINRGPTRGLEKLHHRSLHVALEVVAPVIAVAGSTTGCGLCHVAGSSRQLRVCDATPGAFCIESRLWAVLEPMQGHGRAPLESATTDYRKPGQGQRWRSPGRWWARVWMPTWRRWGTQG
jgi:hypothetical protein